MVIRGPTISTERVSVLIEIQMTAKKMRKEGVKKETEVIPKACRAMRAQVVLMKRENINRVSLRLKKKGLRLRLNIRRRKRNSKNKSIRRETVLTVNPIPMIVNSNGLREPKKPSKESEALTQINQVMTRLSLIYEETSFYNILYFSPLLP